MSTDELAAAVEAFHAALDEHDDSTWNHRSNDTVDGYAPDIVRASDADSERRWADQYFAERNALRADLARALPVVEAAGAVVEHWTEIDVHTVRHMDAGFAKRLDALARAVRAGMEQLG